MARNTGRTKALGTKVGAMPAERRGLGVLRIASARSTSLGTMGRAAHCARCLRTLRFECHGGAGVWRGWGRGSLSERSEGTTIPFTSTIRQFKSCRRSATRDSNNSPPRNNRAILRVFIPGYFGAVPVTRCAFDVARDSIIERALIRQRQLGRMCVANSAFGTGSAGDERTARVLAERPRRRLSKALNV